MKRNNILQMTEDECFETTKRNIAYGASLCLVFFPLVFLFMVISKLMGFHLTISKYVDWYKCFDPSHQACFHVTVPKPVALLLAIASVFVIVSQVKKKLDTVSLTEIEEEEDSLIQKKLSLQYYWFVLGMLATSVVSIYGIRLLYFSLK
jgi:hypothetical protein